MYDSDYPEDQEDPCGEFEQLANVIDDRADVTPIEMQAIGQCLMEMDGKWECLEWITTGGIMSFMACSVKDKAASDQVCRDMLDFLSDSLSAFIEIVKPQGSEPPGAKEMMEQGEKRMSEMAKKLKKIGPVLTPMGMFLAVNVLLDIPVVWMAYCEELASAAGMLVHALPLDQAMYFRDILARTQERKLIDLMMRVDACSLSYNSKPFQKAEKWAEHAGKAYEHLVLAKKLNEEQSMDAIVKRFGAPWLGPSVSPI